MCTALSPLPVIRKFRFKKFAVLYIPLETVAETQQLEIFRNIAKIVPCMFVFRILGFFPCPIYLFNESFLCFEHAATISRHFRSDFRGSPCLDL